MELFDTKGCLTDEGLQALIDGKLDELGRLEAAEHLAYCDRCLERYTALLTPQVLEKPAHSASVPVMRSVWAQVMQSTIGRGAVAAVAAAIALTFWSTGVFKLPKVLRLQERQQIQTSQTAPEKPQEKKDPLGKAWDACTELLQQGISFDFLTNGGNNHE